MRPTTMDVTDGLLALQQPDGRWEGEMVWNTMLLSQYVLTRRILGPWPLSRRDRDGIVRHFRTTQLVDGSWPIHCDGPGSVYLTALGYVALRVVGLAATDPLTSAARKWLHAQPDGVLTMPTWGRLWLAMLGLYNYAGINPVPPELILLPRWLPVHPVQLYCHTRYVYLSFAYLYARRYRANLGPLAAALRTELYAEPYEQIDFAAARRRLAGPDVHQPPVRLLRLGYDALTRYERRPLQAVRALALRRAATAVGAELAASKGQGLSPVNALLGCIVLADSGAPRELVRTTLAAIDAWRWTDDAEGVRIAGARSAAWDTAFALRALLAAPATPPATAAIARGYRWLCAAQAADELPAGLRRGRSAIRGGWCFSDGTHRWPVADCTAEALAAILTVHSRPDLRDAIGTRIPDERLFHAVEFVLSRQNPDGGFGTYERMRAPRVVELLNPSEMYVGCMTERSHPECSASCVAALVRFAAAYPGHQPRRVNRAIGRGVRFLRRCQRPDGSYPGSWGINVTYASFFVIEALTAAGVDRRDRAVVRAAEWLIAHQKPDGGWGEHYTSCGTGRYVEHPESQAAMTAWALLAVVRAVGPNHPAARRAADWLMAQRRQHGGLGWPQQAGSGIFFATAVLDYRLYKDIFPTWALADHLHAQAVESFGRPAAQRFHASGPLGGGGQGPGALEPAARTASPGNPWRNGGREWPSMQTPAGFWGFAAKHPDRVAVVDADGSETTFGDLLAEVNRISHGLRSRDLAAGSTIAALLPNCREYVALMLASDQIGGCLVPLSWQLTEPELTHLIIDSGATALFAHPWFAAVAAAVAEQAGIAADLRFGTRPFETFAGWVALTDGQPSTLPGERSAGQLMIYTSGTTGQPKGVRKAIPPVPPEMIAEWAAAELEKRFDLPRGEGVHLVTGPLYHTAPGGFAVRTLHMGHQLVLTDGFDARASLQLIEQHGVTSTHVVPIMLRRWLRLDTELRAAVDLSSLRQVIHAGAPCPTELKQQALDWLGPIVYEYYGATEGGLVSVKPAEWSAHPGTVGQFALGEVRILDEHGNEAPAGESGLIYFKTSPLRFEYHNDPEQTRVAYAGDYFTVGDIGHVEDGSWLYLDDRRVDMINSGGVNVYPAEIEARLLQHEAVADAAVIGVPDAEWGSRPVALIELAPGWAASAVLADELKTHASAGLAAYKAPRAVEFWPSLPRNGAGKLSRAQAREQYLQDLHILPAPANA